MRVWDWIRAFFGAPQQIVELRAAISRSEARMLRQTDAQESSLREAIANLSQDLAETGRNHEKQLSDLRAIVAQLGEQAKQKPPMAGSMADVRRFIGDSE